MAVYRLCQIKKAKQPYFVENSSVNLFSMEELCFYMYHNLYLLDETILNTGLTKWLREELELAVLARRLEKLLQEEASLSELILPVMKEIQYLSQKEQKELQQKLQMIEEQPPLLRQKMKGDHLIKYQKFGNALKVYQKILKKTDDSVMGQQFVGSIYYNMGCAYAQLFQMQEAISMFEKSYDLVHSQKALRSYLMAVCLGESKEVFSQRAEALEVEEEILNEITAELLQTSNELEEAKKEEELEQILLELTETYHRNTGF